METLKSISGNGLELILTSKSGKIGFCRFEKLCRLCQFFHKFRLSGVDNVRERRLRVGLPEPVFLVIPSLPFLAT